MIQNEYNKVIRQGLNWYNNNFSLTAREQPEMGLLTLIEVMKTSLNTLCIPSIEVFFCYSNQFTYT